MSLRAPVVVASMLGLAVWFLSACSAPADEPTPVVTVSAPVTATPEPPAPSPTEPGIEPTEPTSTPVPPEQRPATGATVTPDLYMVQVQGDELWVVVYVPGIFETGGTCTVTVTTGTNTFTQENVSEADASSTACGLFTFALDGLAGSSAAITAHYRSADYEGESDTVEVQIP